ncbi:MAG: alpha/beta hydrolase [Candidatus Altiarchaeota archaeon]
MDKPDRRRVILLFVIIPAMIMSLILLWKPIFMSKSASCIAGHKTYPSNVEKNSVILNGRQVTYADSGSGEVILLIHGMGSSSSVYSQMTPLLADKYRCIAVDLPGYGGSEYQRMDSLDSYTDFISEFKRELGLNDTFCIGHSFGGTIMSHMSYSRPNVCKKIVNIDGVLFMYVPTFLQERFLSNLKADRLSVFDPVHKNINERLLMDVEKSSLMSADYSAMVDSSNAVMWYDFSAGDRVSSPPMLFIGAGGEMFFSTSRLQLLPYKLYKLSGPVYANQLQLRLFRRAYGLYPEDKFVLRNVHSPSHYPMLDCPDELSELIDGFFEDNVN